MEKTIPTSLQKNGYRMKENKKQSEDYPQLVNQEIKKMLNWKGPVQTSCVTSRLNNLSKCTNILLGVIQLYFNIKKAVQTVLTLDSNLPKPAQCVDDPTKYRRVTCLQTFARYRMRTDIDRIYLNDN